MVVLKELGRIEITSLEGFIPTPDLMNTIIRGRYNRMK
jgi:hypothetical protein